MCLLRQHFVILFFVIVGKFDNCGGFFLHFSLLLYEEPSKYESVALDFFCNLYAIRMFLPRP